MEWYHEIVYLFRVCVCFDVCRPDLTYRRLLLLFTLLSMRFVLSNVCECMLVCVCGDNFCVHKRKNVHEKLTFVCGFWSCVWDVMTARKSMFTDETWKFLYVKLLIYTWCIFINSCNFTPKNPLQTQSNFFYISHRHHSTILITYAQSTHKKRPLIFYHDLTKKMYFYTNAFMQLCYQSSKLYQNHENILFYLFFYFFFVMLSKFIILKLIWVQNVGKKNHFNPFLFSSHVIF